MPTKAVCVRTELNSILAALSSLQSGSSEPSTTNAYQLWVDTSTTPGKLKIRNGANSAWIVVADDITAVNLGLIAASGGTFTGDVTMNAQSDVRFADSDSSNYVALQGAATISSNLTFTLPTSYGSSGQFLETAGDGTVSFSSLPVGSTSQQGILQLTDSTSSTSTTTAATPDSVRSAYSLANSALPKSGGQMTGNITFSGTQTVDGRDLSADGSKLDGIEASADVTDATNVDAAGAVMNSDTSTASMSFVIDEDNMSSNSATKVPTQQSVKAYVDASGGGASEIDDLSDAKTQATNNIGIGSSSIASLTSGSNNVAFGTSGLYNTTTGSYSISIGANALYANTTGSKNIAIGYQALEDATTVSSLIAVGYRALANNTSGTSNVAIGDEAMAANTTGNSCVAVGNAALDSQTTGYSNTAIGYQSLTAVTSGRNTVAVGHNAGKLITTGIENTSIGFQAAENLTTGSNNTSLGYDAKPSSATSSNQVTLGNAFVSSLRCNQTSITSLSDGRDKTEVEDLPVGLDFIDSLRPVKFQWQTRDGNSKDGTYEAGFIAQDLQSAQSAADADYLGLVMDENPDRLEASYGKLVPMLVKAVQELKSEVEQLKANA